jgi:hypothetical protein
VEEPEGGVRVEDVHGDAGVKVETLKKKNIQNLIFQKNPVQAKNTTILNWICRFRRQEDVTFVLKLKIKDDSNENIVMKVAFCNL